MNFKSDRSFLERPLSKKAAALVFSGLILPVIGFFVFSVSVWEVDASARSRALEVAMDQARIEAGFPAVEVREGALLEPETARRIIASHFAAESGRLTAEGGGRIVAMSVEEVTNFCADSSDSGEIRGVLLVAKASLLDDSPVVSEQRTFVASIRGNRVVEVFYNPKSF